MYLHQQNLKSIFYSICYSDIFDYPLSKEIVFKYAISSAVSKKETQKYLSILKSKNYISEENGYFCIKGKEKNIKELLKRKKISEKKNLKAKRIVNILKKIPSIKLIGVSGSLALDNAKEQDDIDLFFISKKNTMWLTRLFVLLTLLIFGIKRSAEELTAKDKICANMFLDESNLVLPPSKQNIYTAHEVAQVKPLFEREGMYNKFLFKNNWIKKFLPNSVSWKTIKSNDKQTVTVSEPLLFFEAIAEKLQLFYMRKKRTKEIITSSLLAFHPKDMQEIVLRKYKERIKRYAI